MTNAAFFSDAEFAQANRWKIEKKTLRLGKVRDENYYWVSKNMDCHSQ